MQAGPRFNEARRVRLLLADADKPTLDCLKSMATIEASAVNDGFGN